MEHIQSALLKKSDEFWIDNDDREKVGVCAWTFSGCSGHIVGSPYGYENGNVLLHRYIMDVVDNPSVIIDHKVHPKPGEHIIDNRKSNLRIATPADNVHNSNTRKNSKSGMSGVWYRDIDDRENKWVAEIKRGEIRKIAYFKTFEEAVKQRREWELEYDGEFAFSKYNQ